MATQIKAITTFDQDTAKEVRTKTQEALERFAESLGVGVTLERGTLGVGGNQFTIPIVFVIKGEGGVLETEERQAYKLWGSSFSLKPEWLGRTFTHKGEVFTITGLKANSAKFPVQAVNTKGATFGFPATSVVGYMTGDVDGAYEEKYRKAYLESFHSTLVKEWKEWLDKPFQYNGVEAKAVGLMESIGRSRKPDVVIAKIISGDREGKQIGLVVEVFKGIMTGNVDAALKTQTEDRVRGFRANWYKREKFGVPDNWLGVSVTFGAKGDDARTIVGLDPKSKRYPIVLQDTKGELSLYQVNGLRMLMMKQHPELPTNSVEKFVE
jgi:hypothetical protein